MRAIRSIIIDDEVANRNVLDSLLKRHCPSVELIGMAASAQEGYELIGRTQPDLVFLDVKMPFKTGFDLLRMFDEIPFQVIFVTAFDEYAIQAFEFSAVDYLLKPIDYTKLIRSVEKAERSLRFHNNDNVIHFIRSMDEKNQLAKSISLHKKDKVVIVDIDKICYIQASGNYCEVVTEDNQRLISAKTLADYEELLQPYPHFLRINKSVLVNIHYIREYSKGVVCFMTVKNCDREMEVSRRKKGEVLHYLKSNMSSQDRITFQPVIG